MLAAAPSRMLGRYLEPALWVLIALDGHPLGLTALLDAVRSLDGPIGHGSLVAAVSRLERLRLVESSLDSGGLRVYRLTILGRVGAGSAAMLRGQPR
jgi:DNA-binding PadR family transcriptional regulator